MLYPRAVLQNVQMVRSSSDYALREGGKVNITLEQDHPCLLLSIPQEYKPLERAKECFDNYLAEFQGPDKFTTPPS